VAVECVPAWNTDGIVTDGEVENFSWKQLSVSLCRPKEVYIAFTVSRLYLWISGEVCKTALNCVNDLALGTVSCKLVQSHLVKTTLLAFRHNRGCYVQYDIYWPLSCCSMFWGFSAVVFCATLRCGQNYLLTF